MKLAEAALRPENRPYGPRGAMLDVMYCKAPEVCLSGPAGTGKSRGNLEKLHACAEKYPRMRALILRKTRESVSESALVTFEEHVLPEGHPAKLGAGRHHRQVYSYPNGSQVVVGGLDKPGKIMSTEFDLIYCQELIEFLEEDWNALLTRLRNGRMPYQQAISDTNPGHPKHWIKLREAAGKMVVFETRHEDNPVYFDPVTRQWTPRGLAYLATLDNLTGIQHDRLRRGLWVGAEGLVYTEYDPRFHLVDPFLPTPSLDQYCIIDPAARAACGILFGQVSKAAEIFLWAELYDRETQPAEHLRNIARTLEKGKINPHRVDFIMDPNAWNLDPAGRSPVAHEWMEQASILGFSWFTPRAANNDKQSGIPRVKRYLRVLDPNGKKVGPRLFVSRTLEKWQWEITQYIWKPEPGGIVSEQRPEPEEPIKRNDHLLDCTRYLVNEMPEPTPEPEPKTLIDRLENQLWLPPELRTNPRVGGGQGIDYFGGESADDSADMSWMYD